jgi:hypothetical protein
MGVRRGEGKRDREKERERNGGEGGRRRGSRVTKSQTTHAKVGKP